MGNINSSQSNCLNLEKLGVKISKVTFALPRNAVCITQSYWSRIDFTRYFSQLVNTF